MDASMTENNIEVLIAYGEEVIILKIKIQFSIYIVKAVKKIL